MFRMYVFFSLGKRIQETVCLVAAIGLIIWNFIQLVRYFQPENWFVVIICACKFNLRNINPTVDPYFTLKF